MNLSGELWNAWVEGMQSLTVGQYFQALSLPMSMLVAWLTFKAATSNLRHSQILSDVTQLIKAFSESCGKLADEIEKHYLGEYADGFSAAAAKESRKRILGQIKLLDAQRAVLDVFLTAREVQLLRQEFDVWQTRAIGDSFPVTRKEDRLKDFEQPITDLRNARTALDCYLADLRRCCVTNRKRCRRVLR